MRSHAEMRELASGVLASYEPPSASERQLAKDVVDLLDGLAPDVDYDQSRQTDSEGQVLIMLAMIVTLFPTLIVGKYVSWWLALGIWEVGAVAYFLTDFRKWRGERWIRTLGVPVIAFYGPVMLAHDVLRSRLLPQHDSVKD